MKKINSGARLPNPPHNLTRRARAIVRAIWNNWRSGMDSDVLEDCLQETSILAWRIDTRLASGAIH